MYSGTRHARSVAAVVLLFVPYIAKRLFELGHPGWIEWLAVDYGARAVMLVGAVVARPTLAKTWPAAGRWRFAALFLAVGAAALFVSLVVDPVVYRALRDTPFIGTPFPRIEHPAIHAADLLLGLWLVALSEELAFRWYAVRRLEQLGFRPGAVLLLSAALFAVFHVTRGLPTLVFSFLDGLMFGFFYQRTRRLWPVVVCHYAVDFLGFSGLAARLST